MKEALLCQPETKQGAQNFPPPSLAFLAGSPFLRGWPSGALPIHLYPQLQAAPLPSIQAPLFALGAGGLE